jgi:membrane protease YdiL (CAAX protease family)
MQKEKAIQIISHWKTELISSAIVLLCLLLAVKFPAQGSLQLFSSMLFFLFLLPILYIKIILKQNLADFGFNLQNKLTGLLWGFGMLLVSFLILFILLHFYNFAQNYLIPAYLAQNFWSFLFYELILVNFLLFIQEFFFKGFLLFLFAKHFGLWSVILQSLIFILFLVTTSSLNWKLAPILILSVTGGVVAYKSKSFIYSFVMSLFFLIVTDAYIIYLFK